SINLFDLEQPPRLWPGGAIHPSKCAKELPTQDPSARPNPLNNTLDSHVLTLSFSAARRTTGARLESWQRGLPVVGVSDGHQRTDHGVGEGTRPLRMGPVTFERPGARTPADSASASSRHTQEQS